LIHW